MKKANILIISLILSVSCCFGSLAGEWKQENSGWKYQEDNGSNPTNSWKEINGKWYYFNEGGYMLSNTITPDGYKVNDSGEWIQPESATNVTSSGKKYEFKEKGKWVEQNKIPVGEYVYYPETQIKDPIVSGSSSLNCNINYVKLYTGDIVNPGIYVSVSEAGELDTTKEGVFLVGRDIKAGTYNLKPYEYDGTRLIISMCTVFNAIPSSKDATSPNKNIDQDFHIGYWTRNKVEVKDGQYIQLIGASADFVRP